MTVGEFLACPKGMDIQKYSRLLDGKRRLEKKISQITFCIERERDALDVLSDEKGSDRWQKHADKLEWLEQSFRKACDDYKELEQTISAAA